MTVIKKKLMDKIMVNHKIDLVNHLYLILLEIQKLDPHSKRSGRKIQIVNIYDNWVRKVYIWDSRIYCIKKILRDVNWKPVIQSRVLIARDINTHSFVWNP